MKAGMHSPGHYAPSVPQDAASYAGGFRMHANFFSKMLPSPRNVIVYLPPGYQENETERYATLYMQDGQNLFDGETSYVAGQDWKMARTTERLILESRIEPLIIVGIWNAGLHRMGEYTPSHDASVGDGGLLAKYGRLIVEDLKPFIDTRYRTKPEREHTGIGGSSLGGLASLLLGLHHSETFSRIASISPSLWWDEGVAYRLIQNLKRKPQSRIWLDMGTKESASGVASLRLMRDLLINLGWELHSDLFYQEVRGGRHSETNWAKRVAMVLRKLYPPPPRKLT